MTLTARRTLRAAHVIPSVADEAAGPSYTVPALCDALGREGAEVELHVVGACATERHDGAAYTLCSHHRTRLLAPVDGSVSMQAALRRRGREFDVFHVHGLWRLPGLYAASAAARAAKPVMLTPRGMLEPAALRFSARQKRLFWWAGQGLAVHRAHCLHATSEGELQTLRGLGLRNPVAMVPNGVHLPPLSIRTRPKRDRTLLYLGRIHPIKALDRLLDAWSQLEPRFPSWNLRFVGPCADDYRARLEAQCRALGVRRVTFGAAAFGDDKQREFEAAQLYVLPSHSENFGMTVAEALAARVPVVASTGTPWRGLEAEGCGRWVDNSVRSLSEALEGLLVLPSLELAAMGARGRAWVEREFSWAHKAQQMLEVYEWLREPSRACPSCVDTVDTTSRARHRTLGALSAQW